MTALRASIARDLHDDVGADLTRLTLLVEQLKDHVGPGPSTALELMERVGKLSRTIGRSMNNIVWSLAPERDPEMAPTELLRTLVRSMLQETGIGYGVRFRSSDPRPALGPSWCNDVRCIIKEAIHNAMKHSQATRLAVHLHIGKERFRLIISDNGTGFDSDASLDCGRGLRNMRIRATALGGDLDIRSDQATGTRVIVAGPVFAGIRTSY